MPLPLPLERSDAILDISDPNIILGPYKHRPTEHLLENGDPFASKKVRMHMSTTVAVSKSLSSMPLSDCLILMPLSSPSTYPTDSAESNDDQSSDSAQAIMVDDDSNEEGSDNSDEGQATEEDDDAELGMWFNILDDFVD
jgi:hypothetical protein